MAGTEDASAGAKEDPEEKRRHQSHLKFTASHQARHAARQQTSARGEGGVGYKGEDRPKEESAALFNENFAASTQDITRDLARLVAESKQAPSQTAAGTGLSGARHAHPAAAAALGGREDVRGKLDALVDRVKGLRKRTAEATLFLTVYDLRRAQEEADKLWASVESTRAELAPRKKFAFRSKGKAGGKLKNNSSGEAAAAEVRRGASAAEAEGEAEDKDEDKEVRRGEDGDAAPKGRVLEHEQEQEQGRDGDGDGLGLGLHGLREQEVEVLAEDADKDKDFNVADLDKCKVTILHVLGTLRLRRLTSCRVVCGPVRGPIYLEGCKDCVIVAAGRQLRIHDSQGVDFYVLVASGPIVEDCCGLRFAPTGLRYPEYQDQLQVAGLDKVTNAWEDVKDFKWHRAQKSPNWDIIVEAERESDSLVLKAPK